MTFESVRAIPSVHEILRHDEIAHQINSVGHSMVADIVRRVIDELRKELQRGQSAEDRPQLTKQTIELSLAAIRRLSTNRLHRVINGTGMILHTGLGRAPLARQAIEAIVDAAGNCNLEVDVVSGERRMRGYQVEKVLQQLTGAQNSLIVNNNAAATLLVLQALFRGQEVIISRGQLIEIGGSFRLPDIFSLSGCALKEVGTTNRTHISDYEQAINPATGAILRVHPSNFHISGFTCTPSIHELVKLGRQHGIPVIDDIGSGQLVSSYQSQGNDEPSFPSSIQAGADLVLGSGDKLLGGPQCGIILGRSNLISSISKHPLARALRIDKLTLAALSATLDLYLRGLSDVEIPVHRMIQSTLAQLVTRGTALQTRLKQVSGLIVATGETVSEIGGGSLPSLKLPSLALILQAACSAQTLAEQLRLGSPSVFGRVHQDMLWLDLRTIAPQDDDTLVECISKLSLPSPLRQLHD